MLSRSLLLAATVLTAAFAGCSDAPPSGALADLDLVLQVDGTASIDYTQEERPLDEGTGQDSPVDCVDDTLPEQFDDFKCVDPATNITIHFMALPDPVGGSYEAFLTGSAPAMSLGTLVADGEMFNLPPFVEAVDYSAEGAFDTIEIRYGDFVYATAPAAEGDQNFAVGPGLDAITATGEYKGKTLTVEVAGLPANGTYTAHLYQPGADGVTLESVEHFPVQNGENVLEPTKTVDKYVQFHIHVGESKINIFQAAIE